MVKHVMLLDIYQCFIFPDKYPHVDQIKTQVANPDFMAVLAPQWPEPDPDPTEDQAFLQQQVRSINLLPFPSQSCRKYNFFFAEAWTG